MIETEVMSNRFIGDGNNKTFAFGFKFNNKNDIQVWLYDSTTKQLTQRSDFTLTPNNSVMPSEGGTVTFPSEGAAIPSTQMVIIQRHMNLFQLDVYKHGMFLDLDNFEHSLDTLVMELQQINDSVERAVKVSIVPDAQQVDPIIPPLEAGQTIMVSEDGKHFVAADISELFAQTTSAWAAADTSQRWAESDESPDNNDDEDSTTGKSKSSKSWSLYAKDWSESSNSPDGKEDADSTTGKTQSAKSWALDSRGSKQAAATSETNAKTSEINAKASENAAATSETNAKTSETNAKASENAAKTSENNAKTSETNAADSESAAATSEQNAAASEQAAATSETNAANSESMSQKWAESPTSPDGLEDKESNTGQTQSAKQWAIQAKNEATSFQDFVGATADSDGYAGRVPAPKAGDQGKFLSGDGSWEVARMTDLEIVKITNPVGTIRAFNNTFDPNTAWAGTTWQRFGQGRVLVGAGQDGGTNFTLGSKGGEEKHKLSVGEMPSHGHGATVTSAGGHTHKPVVSYSGGDGLLAVNGDQRSTNNQMVRDLISMTSAGSHTHGATISNNGSSQAHNNLQPYVVVNYWVRIA